MVSSHPGLAKAMVNMHRRFRNTSAQLAAATEDRHATAAGSGSITMAARGSGRLLLSAAELHPRPRHRRGGPHRAPALPPPRRHRRRDRPAAREPARRPDRPPHRSRRERACTLAGTATTGDPGGSRSRPRAVGWAAGVQVRDRARPTSSSGDLLRRLVDEGNFTSDEARSLARDARLANYFAAATVLRTASSTRSRRTSCTTSSGPVGVLSTRSAPETICHRLSTLQRPKQRGVPWSFVRVDRAGNMSKRQSATVSTSRPAAARARCGTCTRRSRTPARS